MGSRETSRPICGAGIGLRSQHFQLLEGGHKDVPWLEALTDNYLSGGASLHWLERLRRDYPVTLHGVGMSLGSCDPLNWEYLKEVRTLSRDIQASWVSDHLAWCGFGGVHSHDLLPMPYTEEAIQHISERLSRVQDYFGHRLLVENVSTYLQYADSSIPEWEFVNAIAERADCDLLLDINNIYVSAFNQGFDPRRYIDSMAVEKVKEIHLAGFLDCEQYLLDTHGRQVQEVVWDLFEYAQSRFQNVPTLIEWDTDIPDLSVILADRSRAQTIMSGEEITHEVA